jgi:hypothetical protein
MRLLVVLLVLMATTKVATLEWLHRAASDDVIVSAYRPRALEACAVQGQRLTPAVDTKSWTTDTAIHLEIGRRGKSVAVWQVNDPAWTERFRNPYLHLDSQGASGRVRCAYDIVNGQASAKRG